MCVVGSWGITLVLQLLTETMGVPSGAVLPPAETVVPFLSLYLRLVPVWPLCLLDEKVTGFPQEKWFDAFRQFTRKATWLRYINTLFYSNGPRGFLWLPPLTSVYCVSVGLYKASLDNKSAPSIPYLLRYTTYWVCINFLSYKLSWLYLLEISPSKQCFLLFLHLQILGYTLQKWNFYAAQWGWVDLTFVLK